MERYTKQTSAIAAKAGFPMFAWTGFLFLVLCFSSAFAAEITGKGFPLRSGTVTPYATATTVNANIPYAQNQTQPHTGKQVAATPAASGESTVATTLHAGESGTAAFEGSPLVFSGNDRQRSSQRGENKSFSLPSIWPALFAVMAVCGLFIAGLYFMKKYLPGHRQLFNHPAMELLGRTHLDQRRFVTLLRVGRRLVVVGVSQDEMRTLSEITDEAEITEIMEVARPKTEVGLTVFQKLFQRNVVEAEAEEARAMAREKVVELDAQMSALRERVREIRADDSPVAEVKKPVRRKLDAVG